MLATLVLAGALTDAASPCPNDPPSLRSQPAVLTPSLSATYPDGVSVRFTVVFDAAGHAAKRTAEYEARRVPVPGDAALATAVSAWADAHRFTAPLADCAPVVGPQEVDVDFFPQASGVVGQPEIVNGVDFATFHYTSGPGNCANIDLAGGTGDYQNEYDASIHDLFAGRIGGTPVAVVVLRCEYNGHGFDENAQLFDVSGGHAKRLGILGEGSLAGADSAFPPFPGAWLHVGFHGGRLFADVWNSGRQCDRSRDWIGSSYAIRDGKLALLSESPHSRAGDFICDRH